MIYSYSVRSTVRPVVFSLQLYPYLWDLTLAQGRVRIESQATSSEDFLGVGGIHSLVPEIMRSGESYE